MWRSVYAWRWGISRSKLTTFEPRSFKVREEKLWFVKTSFENMNAFASPR